MGFWAMGTLKGGPGGGWLGTCKQGLRALTAVSFLRHQQVCQSPTGTYAQKRLTVEWFSCYGLAQGFSEGQSARQGTEK